MNTSLRTLVSTSIALGLAAFTVVSAFAFGVATPATLLGFGFLAAYGVLEIAVASYEGPRLVSARRPAPRVNVVVYPASTHEELARAA